MHKKRKIAEILSVSFLLSVSIIVILLNFFLLGPTTNEGNESFAGTFLFISVYACAVALAYILRDRFILRFTIGYFIFNFICSAITFFASFFDFTLDYVLAVFAVPPVAFLGTSVLIPWQYTVAVSSALFSCVFIVASLLMLRNISKKEKEEAILKPHVKGHR